MNYYLYRIDWYSTIIYLNEIIHLYSNIEITYVKLLAHHPW